ncbi:hypothetical protein G7054_g7608 [Neopestalotiopsis clavispora]|nr:hypothetical protein G7054_g7608 [Neopestalotiopsis clavispora]
MEHAEPDSELVHEPLHSPSTESEFGPTGMLQQIKLLEDRIKTLESNEKTDAKPAQPEDVKKTSALPDFTLRPTVRWCNFERYKNYFGDEDDTAAIDVLKSNEQLNDQVRQELSRRDLAKDGKFDAALVPDLSLFGNEEPRIQSIRIKSKIILRILARISAKYGLYHMTVDLPVSFTRPFDYLIFSLEELKREILRLPVRGSTSLQTDTETASTDTKTKEVAGDSQATSTVPKTTPRDTASTYVDARADVNTLQESLTSDLPRETNGIHRVESVTRNEMAILQCYVDFMEEHIMPRYKQLAFGNAGGDFSKKIHFDDLWWLFKPGDLLYTSPVLQIGKPRPSTEQRIWRLFKVTDSGGEWNLDAIEREHSSSLGKKEKKEGGPGEPDRRIKTKALVLLCYYLDYTGTGLCPVLSRVTIDRFAGEIEMSSLKTFPLRFVTGEKEISATLRAERSNFTRYTSTTPRPQVMHDGWSVAMNVEGWDIISDDDYHKYIDSEVIVDFEESFQAHPNWRPNFFWTHIREQPRTEWKLDSFPIIHWRDPQRSSIISEQQDLFLVKSGLNSLETNQWVAKDRFVALTDYASSNLANFMGHRRTSAPPSEPPTVTELSDDELLLLPIRLFAYSLRDRRFFQIDIRNLREIEQVQDPFRSLQIDHSHKDTVESLLYTHFDRKTLDRRPGPAIPDQDLIRGKGRGVIILLHGAPGVGKTATAEAVAQKHGKPLFSISCGDLGYEPDRVESALEDIFRLAQVWDCILLLDEADVFLTQRFPNDLQRNAMVSMILRILEYYKGVLFLTTNRPGVLDEALKSRVHVSLHYPSLDLEKSKEIFRINLERLVLIEKRRNEKSQDKKLVIFEQEILDYATTHFQRYGSTGLGSWNGRQIRNAFQVASSFARYDGTKVPEAQAQLRASHFEKVATMMYTYDEFRKQTLRKGDMEQAKSLGHRDDTYGIQAPGRPPEINIQGQHYGLGPGGVPNLDSQAPYMQQRGYGPYPPGQNVSGYPGYIPSAATRANVSSQSGPAHQQDPTRGSYGGPSAYER